MLSDVQFWPRWSQKSRLSQNRKPSPALPASIKKRLGHRCGIILNPVFKQNMKILIACEFSGIVREEFRKRGHDVTSCDFLPTEILGKHYQGDVMDIITMIDVRFARTPGMRKIRYMVRFDDDYLKEKCRMFSGIPEIFCTGDKLTLLEK